MKAVVFLFTFITLECIAQPTLVLPLDCEPGNTCVVQNYVERGSRDYRCGFLTYQGHKGTDLRVTDHDEFVRGVAVTAAAAGRVRAVRDGMQDISIRASGAPSVEGKEAGNSVLIEHGEGWETQYSHMRLGSVKVRAGDQVERGAVLGVVGLSGQTEFPHLHFEVRRAGRPVDPFDGQEPATACGAGGAPLWGSRTMRALEYQASGVLDAGISGSEPLFANGAVDRAKLQAFSKSSGVAMFWAQIYGLQQGDLQQLRFLDPGGKVIAERKVPVSRNLAQSFASIGASRRIFSWSAGTYRGEYTLLRGSEKVVELSREITVPR